MGICVSNNTSSNNDNLHDSWEETQTDGSMAQAQVPLGDDYEQMSVRCMKWSHAVAKQPIPTDRTFHETMKDGHILCLMANVIEPGVIQPTEPSEYRDVSRKNINDFLAWMKERYAVPDEEVFRWNDLFESRNLPRVIDTLFTLSSLLERDDSYRGPRLRSRSRASSAAGSPPPIPQAPIPGGISAPMPGGAPIPGGAPMAAPIPGGAPMAAPIPGGAPMAAPIPGGAPMAAPIPGGAPMAAPIPGGAPMAAPIPGGMPMPPPIPGQAPIPMGAPIPGGAPLPYMSTIPGGAPIPIPGGAPMSAPIPGFVPGIPPPLPVSGGDERSADSGALSRPTSVVAESNRNEEKADEEIVTIGGPGPLITTASQNRLFTPPPLTRQESVAPGEFRCPLTLELFTDPVVASDGMSYERHAIEEWFQTHDVSPMTNMNVESKVVYPNRNLKKLVDRFKKEYPDEW